MTNQALIDRCKARLASPDPDGCIVLTANDLQALLDMAESPAKPSAETVRHNGRLLFKGIIQDTAWRQIEG